MQLAGIGIFVSHRRVRRTQDALRTQVAQMYPSLVQMLRQCPIGQGGHAASACHQLDNDGSQFSLAYGGWFDIGRIQKSGKDVQSLFFDRIGNEHLVGKLRSEEHTSELQSLMRNSYAVFCLKKKTTNKSYQLSKTYIA